MNIFVDQVESLKLELNNYYSKVFDSEFEDYSENKRIKDRIYKLILHVNDYDSLSYIEKIDIIDELLVILASSTGCQEDSIIAEEILDSLYAKKVISTQQIKSFYENAKTKRWE